MIGHWYRFVLEVTSGPKALFVDTLEGIVSPATTDPRQQFSSDKLPLCVHQRHSLVAQVTIRLGWMHRRCGWRRHHFECPEHRQLKLDDPLSATGKERQRFPTPGDLYPAKGALCGPRHDHHGVRSYHDLRPRGNRGACL